MILHFCHSHSFLSPQCYHIQSQWSFPSWNALVISLSPSFLGHSISGDFTASFLPSRLLLLSIIVNIHPIIPNEPSSSCINTLYVPSFRANLNFMSTLPFVVQQWGVHRRMANDCEDFHSFDAIIMDHAGLKLQFSYVL